MTDKKSNDSRRKLLKSIAAGSGAVVAGKTLPESWSKPVIDTVLLPTHAATTETTSCPTTVNSAPTSLTVEALSGAPDEDQDGIEITFDGCNSLTLVKGDDPTGSADSITFLDVDSADSNVFDAETGPGANWQMISNSFPSDPAVSNVPEGAHTIQVKRLLGPTTGTVYTISFNVAVNDVTGGNEMTLSAVQASAN